MSVQEQSCLVGGCRCGAVTYSIAADELPPVYSCHCLDCQSVSGSAFSEQAVIADGSLSAEGPVLDQHFKRADGSHGHHRLCARCYTRLWSTSTGTPGLALVRAGTLQRSQEIRPRAHMWTMRKQHWFDIPGDVPQWPESPPANELAQVLRNR